MKRGSDIKTFSWAGKTFPVKESKLESFGFAALTVEGGVIELEWNEEHKAWSIKRVRPSIEAPHA